MSLDIELNRISGGATAIVLGAHVDNSAFDASQASFVGTNLILDTLGDAIVVEASGSFSTEVNPATAEAVPLIVGNTISDGGGAGLISSATRTDSTGDPSVHVVRSIPEVWDNLITHNAGAGIEESVDDVATNLVADPIVVGNDLFGNTRLYRDEGTTDLNTIGDVNALAEAQDNLDTDPFYVDRPADDYRLQMGTSLVVEFSSSMNYLTNTSDPGLDLTWTQNSFDDGRIEGECVA